MRRRKWEWVHSGDCCASQSIQAVEGLRCFQESNLQSAMRPVCGTEYRVWRTGVEVEQSEFHTHAPVRWLSNKCKCTNLCNWLMLVGIGPVNRFPYSGTFGSFHAHDRKLHRGIPTQQKMFGHIGISALGRTSTRQLSKPMLVGIGPSSWLHCSRRCSIFKNSTTQSGIEPSNWHSWMSRDLSPGKA